MIKSAYDLVCGPFACAVLAGNVRYVVMSNILLEGRSGPLDRSKVRTEYGSSHSWFAQDILP